VARFDNNEGSVAASAVGRRAEDHAGADGIGIRQHRPRDALRFTEGTNSRGKLFW